MVDVLSTKLATIQDWIIAKKSEGVILDIDTDLIESRLIDSLDFAEFLFLLEELSARPIDLDTVDLQTFRTLRNIQKHFLLEG